MNMEGDETSASSVLVDTSRFKVEHLNVNNYFLLSKKLELILRRKGLWKLVAGDEQLSGREYENPRPLSTEEIYGSNYNPPFNRRFM